MQIPCAGAVDHVGVEALRRRIGSNDGEQRTVGGIGRAIERNPVDMPRQPHAMLDSHLKQAGRLEAKFDQPRRDRERLIVGVMIARKVGRHLTDGAVLIPPGPLEHAISRAVEVDAVDVFGVDDRSLRRTERQAVRRFAKLCGQTYAAGKMRLDARIGLVGEDAAAGQPAIRDQAIAIEPEPRLDGDRARLAAIELERRQEFDILDCFHRQPGAIDSAASAKPSIPITPGSTGVPSMR
jgi:hypothetical protein